MSLQATGSLRAFLASAKKCLQNALAKQERINLVIGNESADLDSITSSIVFAYFRSQSLPASSSLYVPILNIPRADVRIRAELLKLLPYANLEPDDLITLDEIQQSRRQLKPENTRWCLTDHNSLQGSLGDTYASRVFGCIDHHVEENEVPKDTGDEPRIIKPTGSCTSLVINHFHDAWEELSDSSSKSKAGRTQNESMSAADRKALDAQIAKFALASILVDTSDLRSKEKVTDDDEKAVEYLESKIKLDPNATGKFERRKFYQDINKAKLNLDGLSIDEMLRKDYKQWTEKDVKIGVSSVVQSLSYMLSKADASKDATKAFLNELRSFSSARDLGVLAVMTKSSSPAGESQKELLLWELHPSTKTFGERFAHSSQAELRLESWNEHPFGEADSSIKVWWQRNTDKTRKQVAPMLRETLNT